MSTVTVTADEALDERMETHSASERGGTRQAIDGTAVDGRARHR